MSCVKGCSFKVVTSQSVLAWLGAVSVCSKSWKWPTDSMSCVIPWHFSSVQSASPLVFALLSVRVNRLSKTCFVTCYFICFPPHHPTSLLVNFRNPFSSIFIQRFFHCWGYSVRLNWKCSKQTFQANLLVSGSRH